MGVSPSSKLRATMTKNSTLPIPTPTEKKHIFDILAETFDDLPDEVLAELPTDGAENHDHYLYGWPKKTETTDHETADAE